jgi:hypothetical protein
MGLGEKNEYIPAGTKLDQQAMRRFSQSCKALGLKFVEVPDTLHKDMRHLEELSKHALDEFLWRGQPERSHLSEKMVRKTLLRHLKSVERAMVDIIAQLEELVEQNERDQNAVRAIDAVVAKAIEKVLENDGYDGGEG